MNVRLWVAIVTLALWIGIVGLLAIPRPIPAELWAAATGGWMLLIRLPEGKKGGGKDDEI